MAFFTLPHGEYYNTDYNKYKTQNLFVWIIIFGYLRQLIDGEHLYGT